MLRTSIVAKGAAFAASAIVHATAFAVATGHSAESGRGSTDTVFEVIVDVPDDVPPSPPAQAATEPHAPDAPPRTHTHAYPVAPSHD